MAKEQILKYPTPLHLPLFDCFYLSKSQAYNEVCTYIPASIMEELNQMKKKLKSKTGIQSHDQYVPT
jgi:hypothetical protein